MADNYLKSKVVERGFNRRSPNELNKTAIAGRRKLDPLNPYKWKNEAGTKVRSDKNVKNRETKQDLLIMIDTICGTKNGDAFNKLTSITERSKRRF